MNFLRAASVIGALLIVPPAMAAEEWGLPDEQKTRFEARVVDVLCELTGNCAADCGAGARQLGLLQDDGKLVLPFKNAVPFAGAAIELKDFCGKRVIADGLFTTNNGYKLFALQYLRESPAGKWRRANRFLSDWAKRNGLSPTGKQAKRWFAHDPRVKERIAEDGKLGLGPAADRAYFNKQK